MLSEAQVLDFYERTSGELYRYASRLVGGDAGRAEDLVQETYLTLVRQVRGGRTEPVDIGWAITTCRSRFLDHVRRNRTFERTRRRMFERPSDAGAEVASPATEALRQLSDIQRAVIVMRHVDGMSVGDIAASIGRSLHATESLLARAKQSLRDGYERLMATETTGDGR
jgi:RNA polymerase sigma-70 factor (ECF subfamily)